MQLSPLTKRNRSNDIFFFNLETNTHTSLIQKYTRNSTQKSWQIKQQTNWIIFTQKKKFGLLTSEDPRRNALWLNPIMFEIVGSSDVRIFGPRALPCSLLHRILWSPTSKENPPTFCLITYEAKGVVYH